LKAGAIAFSATWDSADIVVVGADDGDMATAVNRVCELSGGAVICGHGSIVGELPLPVFGVISDFSLKEIAKKTRVLNREAKKLGVLLPDPFLTLATLTTAAIPFFRICEEGYVRLKDGRRVGL